MNRLTPYYIGLIILMEQVGEMKCTPLPTPPAVKGIISDDESIFVKNRVGTGWFESRV